MTDRHTQQPLQPTMLSFAGDLPNICSLVGLLAAMLAIYYAIIGNFSIAIISILWAVLFDWTDGIIARKIKGRTNHQREFGGQLDSIIDIVSFGVFPAVFLLSFANFNPWFLPGAFLIVASGSLRLSYFNIFGLVDDKSYMGLALDNNVIVLAFIFLFHGFFDQTMFAIFLHVLFMLFLLLNLAPIKTPKLSGKWFYVLITYNVALTILYSFMLIHSA
jgi:phosphatidylserine synthase